ncbi:shikimate dehydrogenase [Ureibacillus manganicus]|uniref:Shikimate dehydrogenase (NADP(+)) n=1 Tax=Ureibacillus manganicus DSM 26584 TaxID=1384049 RepID=A0A0A3I1F6_9BACL|nr:shikimate dehydrogenase [Ureibacillus manganicus]KGR78569.1 shikimate dehydrogenase [Ureibacillus manganicus DSM 26584]
MKKWFAVIGDPIAQSKSPEMHTSWYENDGIDAAFIPIQVKKEELEKAVDSLKLLGVSGFCVTIPHKQSIIQYLDEIDETARLMGAVNTVVRLQNGKLKGYNTDGDGFVRSLEEVIGEEHRDQSVLIIGAGGAARGIAFALKNQGYENITVSNRTVSKAHDLVDALGIGKAISNDEASETLNQYKILIQTTSAGMIYGDTDLPFSIDDMSTEAIAADIVYNPLMTPFLQHASNIGATIVTGIGMFVHQGAIAYEHWLGHYPNTKAMIEKLTENVK